MRYDYPVHITRRRISIICTGTCTNTEEYKFFEKKGELAEEFHVSLFQRVGQKM